MNPEQSVIDEIDRLVDESLAKPWCERSGYDNDINQPECRCGTDWHGLPKGGCPGSDAEGPVHRPRPFAGMPYRYANGGVVDEGPNGDLPDAIEAFQAVVQMWGSDIRIRLEASIERMCRQMDSVRAVFGYWQIPDDPFADIDGEAFIPLPTPATEEPQTPQQRALPRPSTTPPMWAQDATRSRRRR